MTITVHCTHTLNGGGVGYLINGAPINMSTRRMRAALMRGLHCTTGVLTGRNVLLLVRPLGRFSVPNFRLAKARRTLTLVTSVNDGGVGVRCSVCRVRHVRKRLTRAVAA